MKIGWIGTGVMGASMAGHLQEVGHDMSVFTRSKKRAKALLDNGATWYDSPAEVASNSEIVFSIVGHPEDVQDIFMGKTGILNPEATCKIIVDMTTSQPSLARIIYEEAEKLGIESLDAPVSGVMWGPERQNWRSWLAGKKMFMRPYCRCLKLWEKISRTWGMRAADSTPKWPTRSWWQGP